MEPNAPAAVNGRNIPTTTYAVPSAVNWDRFRHGQKSTFYTILSLPVSRAAPHP